MLRGRGWFLARFVVAVLLGGAITLSTWFIVEPLPCVDVFSRPYVNLGRGLPLSWIREYGQGRFGWGMTFKLVHSHCWRWFENQSCSAHDVLISSELLAELDLDRMTGLLNMTQRLGLGGIAVAFLDLDYPAAAPLGRP